MLKINELYSRLVKVSINKIFGVESDFNISLGDIYQLLSYSSILSLSDIESDIKKAYDIVSRILEVGTEYNENIISACDLILSRIGNFPGRGLLRDKYNKGESPALNLSLSLERIGRETENTYNDITLTNFQCKLLNSLKSNNYLSVSAPTSAGKSFVLSLAVIDKIKAYEKECIVYVVPTRALISEVSNKFRHECKQAGLSRVIIRTAPETIETNSIEQGLIYVLTQERLVSLLSNSYGNSHFHIDTLLIDEAHEIQKGKRGIVLQNAVELALEKHPYMQVMFSSPLISNPEYFFSIFRWRKDGKAFIETISPVTQNILLVNQVRNNTKAINVKLNAEDKPIDLGIYELDFVLRDNRKVQKAKLAEFISRSGGAVIVFEDTPSNAEGVAINIAEIFGEVSLQNDFEEFISSIEEEMHEQYTLITCLRSGVAFHYGNMPSIIRNGIEYFFKRGDIKFIVCTSTLLQGVNLPAKHLVLENPHSGDEPMVRADFLNLAGRAGRLRYEFQGNVWCVRSNMWDNKSFEGETLQTISSAMSKVMEDGGSIISNAIDNVFSPNDDKELADVAFARFYQEVQRDGFHLPYFYELEGTESNEMLEYNYDKVIRMKINIPEELLKLNSGARPDYIQRLYDFFNQQDDLDDYILHSPYQKGGKARMDRAIDIIIDIFSWPVSSQYAKLISVMAHQWMTSHSLKSMINYKIRSSHDLSDLINRGESVDKIRRKTSSLIRDVLNTLENQVRYNLVRYLKIYRETLIYVLVSKGEKDKADKVENISAYLEFGSCNPTELSLMSLGLSRSTALFLKNKFNFPRDSSPEELIEFLLTRNINSKNTPEFRIRELKDVLGV
ncbi:DEAD/DEAH box helicase [Pectobacterium carotovorum]|uniref:DEAD/DEAH box helicase n=1 Tax=Pectobacterium carotovorum TaxID=554 RepID=UPI001CF38149|nr:DEAD/DEAH box helicase [Pectobacterium carotovorum]MCA6968444.1 DEAD/DEAH box helicase [Pectobacterium carotovorum]